MAAENETEATDNILFQPCGIGQMEVKNRFVRSATYEALAEKDGSVSSKLLDMYKPLAKGEIGMIITGVIFVSPEGKGVPKQIGIHKDKLIPGLTKLARTIQAHGSRAVFQLHHAGAQTMFLVSHRLPRGPSGLRRDPMLWSKARPLSARDIRRLISVYAEAARRSKMAGADAVQIHAAHGYLISQFLSPFFNVRTDEWGGSTENRFRFLKEVYLAVREEVGDKYPVLVKMNVNDCTPEPGTTPGLAADYAGRLAELGIDGLEISAGSTTWAPFGMMRGNIPTDDLLRMFPPFLRFVQRRRFQAMEGKYDFEEAYNAAAAPGIKSALGRIPLILVGGLTEKHVMQELVSSGTTDLVSLSRALVREPFLVRKFQKGEAEKGACEACNRCFAAVGIDLPLRCYVKGIPS